jgi:CspA family cold shock protein
MMTKESCSVESGTIKKLTDRGFGFIKTASGAEVFFHASCVDCAFESLVEGQQVMIAFEDGEKGPRATAVETTC